MAETLTSIYTDMTTGPQARFSTTLGTTPVYRWINRAYSRVWHAAPWPWRLAPNQTLAVVGGTQAVAIPADFGQPVGLFDQLGVPMTFRPALDFMQRYNDPAVARGAPVDYTVMGATLYLGPTPISSQSFKFTYLKRLQRYVTGVATTGPLTGGADIPILGYSPAHDDWHWLLLVGGNAIGMKLTQAPQEHYSPLDMEFAAGLEDMIADLGQVEKQEAERSYGQQVWGSEYADKETFLWA